MNIAGIIRVTVQDRKVEIRAGGGCLLIPGTILLAIGFLPIAAFIASGRVREQVLQDSPGLFFVAASFFVLVAGGMGLFLIRSRLDVDLDSDTRTYRKRRTGLFTRKETSGSLDGFDRVNIRTVTRRDCDGCGSNTSYRIELVGSEKTLDLGVGQVISLTSEATQDLADQIARALGYPPLVQRLVREAGLPGDAVQGEAGLTGESSSDAELDTVDLKEFLNELVAQHISQAEWDRWVKALEPTGPGPRQAEAVRATDLRTLSLMNNVLTDAGLRHLGRMTRLHSLFLYRVREIRKRTTGITRWIMPNERLPLTDRGVEHLEGITELRFLSLEQTGVTAAGLKHLRGMTKLRWLGLRQTGVTDAGLEHLKGLTKLEVLDLDGTEVTDAGLAGLAGLRLRELHVPQHAQTELGLKHYLAAVQPPEFLVLGPWNVTDEGLEELEELTQLQTLSVDGARVTDAGLRHVAGLTQLQTLELGNTQVTDAGLRSLAEMKQLRDLSLSNTQVTDAGLRELAGLTQLQTLGLDNTQVTDAGLKGLTEMKQLRDLSLSNTQVTDAGLRELARLTQLQELNLDDTQVTDAGLKELARLTQLQELSVEDAQVTDEGVEKLEEALPECEIYH